MRTIHRRSLLLASLAVLTFVASAIAQERPSGLLNNLEFRQLGARAEPFATYHETLAAGTPAEHKALEEYFLTLAKRYTTTADDHVTLTQAYRGTKIAQASAIHDHLARLARDPAKEATAAADMHKRRATVVR